MQEDIGDIKRVNRPAARQSKAEDCANCSRLNDRAECLNIANARLLSKTWRIRSCFVALQSAVSLKLMPVKLLARDNIRTRGRGTRSHILFILNPLNSKSMVERQSGSRRACLYVVGMGERCSTVVVRERGMRGLKIPALPRVIMGWWGIEADGGAGADGGSGEAGKEVTVSGVTGLDGRYREEEWASHRPREKKEQRDD